MVTIVVPGAYRGGRVFRRRADPHRCRQIRRLGDALDEPLRMRRVGRGKDALPVRTHGGGLVVVYAGGRAKSEPAIDATYPLPCTVRLPRTAYTL
jgi:hypothetical protein